MTIRNLNTPALALLLALTPLACVEQTAPPRCVPGMAVVCACPSGRTGAQSCQVEGQYAECVCDDPSLDAGIEDAASTPEDAASSPEDAASSPDAPATPVADAPALRDAPEMDSPLCFEPQEELCDGRDNDCDGLADEGHICPDDSVHFTEPFAGRVWFVGTLTEGYSGGGAVQRFWPSVSDSYRRIYDPYLTTARFRRSDDALFFASNTGLHQAGPGEPALPTPTCRNGPYDFDAMNRLYYVCREKLYRDGTPLLASVSWLEAVLPSGRSIVVRPALRNAVALLVDVDGTELSRLSFLDWSGTFDLLQNQSSVQGERAWIMTLRALPDGSREFVVVRVDGETGAWDVVRRLPLPTLLGSAGIALPDGRILLEVPDLTTTWDHQFVDYPPEGPVRVIWREAEAPEVRLHGLSQFITGPLE
jgi:hypothetical protein